MKKIVNLVIILVFALRANAQTSESDDTIYTSAGIEESAEFPGGINAFYKFVDENYVKPSSNFKAKIIVSFIVEKDGKLSDINVLGEKDVAISSEMTRVLKMSPNWKPARQNKKIVRCVYTLPIDFPITTKANTK